MTRKISIEFFKEEGFYCAYIGSDEGSGISLANDTKEGLLEDLKPYIMDEINASED